MYGRTYFEVLQVRDQWRKELGILAIPSHRPAEVGGQDVVFAVLGAGSQQAGGGKVVVALDEAIGEAALDSGRC